jgi:hypothetical protein
MILNKKKSLPYTRNEIGTLTLRNYLYIILVQLSFDVSQRIQNSPFKINQHNKVAKDLISQRIYS